MNFSSQGKQLCIDAFKSSLQGLNKSNRWVQLGDTLPWDEIEKLYNQRLNNGKRGAGNKPARMIIGALVIKHKMNLSDEETSTRICFSYFVDEGDDEVLDIYGIRSWVESLPDKNISIASLANSYNIIGL